MGYGVLVLLGSKSISVKWIVWTILEIGITEGAEGIGISNCNGATVNCSSSQQSIGISPQQASLELVSKTWILTNLSPQKCLVAAMPIVETKSKRLKKICKDFFNKTSQK